MKNPLGPRAALVLLGAEMARGLHGAVVVPSPGEAAADREYVMFMGQLGIEGEAAEAGEEGEESGAPAPFFAMTLNGRPDGAAEVIAWDPTTQQYARRRDVHFTAKIGDLVRWRVVNVSPDDAHTFHLHGHRWCDRDGGLTDAQGSCPTGSLPTDNVDLLPAQGLSLEYREDHPGEWMVHCHVVDHVTDGMFAFYDVSP